MVPMVSTMIGVNYNNWTAFFYCIVVLFMLSFFFFVRGTYLERQTNKVGHAATGSVALPAVMRAGGPGMSSSVLLFLANGYFLLQGIVFMG